MNATETLPTPELAGDLVSVLIASGLVLAAVVFVVLEVLLPSFGLLTIGAIACALGAVIVAFGISTNTGVIFLAIAVVLMPVALCFALKLLRRTSLVTEPMPGRTDGLPAFAAGALGVTTSVLRPSGLAAIDGKRVSVVTRGEIVEKGVKIEVVRCEGNRVVVRPARS